jgi:hypothetical protein
VNLTGAFLLTRLRSSRALPCPWTAGERHSEEGCQRIILGPALHSVSLGEPVRIIPQRSRPLQGVGLTVNIRDHGIPDMFLMGYMLPEEVLTLQGRSCCQRCFHFLEQRRTRGAIQSLEAPLNSSGSFGCENLARFLLAYGARRLSAG